MDETKKPWVILEATEDGAERPQFRQAKLAAGDTDEAAREMLKAARLVMIEGAANLDVEKSQPPLLVRYWRARSPDARAPRRTGRLHARRPNIGEALRAYQARPSFGRQTEQRVRQRRNPKRRRSWYEKSFKVDKG